MKKPASKVAHNRPKVFFPVMPTAQIQPKSQFLFHKNLPQWDFSIMTLASGKPNDDNFHCVGLCNGLSGDWCDGSCSLELYSLCEGTENEIEALKTKVQHLEECSLTSDSK